MDMKILQPGVIEFQKGGLKKFRSKLEKYGTDILIITTKSLEQKISAAVGNAEYYICAAGEPTVESVRAAVDFARKRKIAVVAGIGGGSVMDTAKAVAGLYTNEGDIIDYLEGEAAGKVMKNNPLPLVLVPTTSGSGAECTKNAVIMSQKLQFKKSFRDDRLIAKEVLVDAQLLTSVPKDVTAFSGMDAIVQIIESFTAKKANAFTDALCLQSAKYFCSLKKAYDNGDDLTARENMAFVALCSGMSLANSGVGAAHGFAAGLGAQKGVLHGKACAMLIPLVMKANMRECAYKYYLLANEALEKNHESVLMGANALVEYITELNSYLGIPKLSDLKLSDEEIRAVIKKASVNAMNSNPVELSAGEWVEILKSKK